MSENITVNLSNNTNIGVNILGYSSGGVTNFWEMNDTPNSYTGFAENFLLVNSTQNGIKFAQTVPISAVYNLQESLDSKVNIAGYVATDNNYTDAEKSKLEGIAENAEVNVNADWNSVNGDALILNKPNTFTPSEHTQDISTINGLQDALDDKEPANSNIQTHISSTSNPHNVTKLQVGLGSVQDVDTTTTSNIADSLNKRFVTDAQKTILSNTSNTNTGDITVTDSSEIDFTLTGQSLTASIKSGSIDETKLDTSVNASLDKADSALQSFTETDPVFTAWDKSTGIEITENQISDLGDYATNAALANKVDKITGKGLSTEDYTTSEKDKLSGIEANANNYVLPSDVVQDSSYVHTDNNFTDDEQSKLAGLDSADYEPANTNIQSHISSTSNPHGVTKTQVGLGNCDNTSDANKPVSTAQQTALNAKVNKSGDTMTGKLNLAASTLTDASLHIAQGVKPTVTADGDVWNESKGIFFQNNSAMHQLDTDANSVGALTKVVITQNPDNTINASSIDVFIFSQAGWQGDYSKFTVPAITNLALTDNSQNYLIVNYNAGSPIFQITTNAASVNNSNILLAANIWREGSSIHWVATNWGLATANRLNDRLINVQRFTRSSGLMLGESTGRIITLTSGLVWYGITAVSESAVTSASSNCDFYYHVAGVWTKSVVSTYNNSQYDNGTNLVTLNGAGTQYAVNWVYRYIDGSGLPKLAYILGSGNYNQNQAISALVPTPPSILLNSAILVGKIIVAQDAVTAYSITSAFDVTYQGSTVPDHNSLTNLQGGTADEYYHLTNAQLTNVGTISDKANLAGGNAFTGNQTFDTNTLFVDSVNDRVGIGTTGPSALLHIQKDQDAGTFQYLVNGGTGTLSRSGILMGETAGTGGTYGYFGYLNNSFSTAAGQELYVANRFFIQGSAVGGLALAATNAAGYIPFFTGGIATANERMRITSTGNVGINTTTPTAKLQIKGAGTTTGVNFQTLNSAGTALVTGLDSGNVGIGTTSPGQLLSIAKIGANYGSTYISIAGNVTSTSAEGAGLKFYNNYPSTYNIANITTVLSGQYYYADLTFSTVRTGSANTLDERMRITQAGNVGIGTTSPTAKLQVVGLPEYADNASALVAGLTAGAFYRTGDLLKIVH